MSIATFHNVTSTYMRVLVSFHSVKLVVKPIVTLPIMDWSTLTRPCSNPSDWGSQLGFVVAAILKRTLTENRGRSKMSNNVADEQIQKIEYQVSVAWNHKYIYLTCWPTRMRHFLCILRHICRILLFEYVNMIGQNIHIQLMEYDRRGCKQGHWIGGAILYPVARQLFRLFREA